jgi:N-acetylglucosamine-6-phosphate deacetylase
MKKALVNTNIVMPDYIIREGVIIIEDGKIVDFGRKLSTEGIEDITDLNGAYTGPGLIDIHTHADGVNSFFYDDPISASETLLGHGVTDVLPALYFSMNAEELVEAIGKIRKAMESGKAKNIIGLYMEAPYLNPKYGCNKENNPWVKDVNPELYMPVVDAAYDIARVWCLAPEREGIEMFCEDVLKKNPKAVFSVAHSEAEPFQIEKLLKYGLKCATHSTNATGTICKYPECRGVCVDETVFYNDSIYAELICDKMGIHVDPYMLRLVKKIKGDDKIILISDSFIEHGPVPDEGCYDGVDDINFDFTGEIAGTKLTLDLACRNMMMNTGSSLCQVFKYASTNPARMLSLEDRGVVAKGNVANLLCVDAEFNIKHVFHNGELIK